MRLPRALLAALPLAVPAVPALPAAPAHAAGTVLGNCAAAVHEIEDLPSAGSVSYAVLAGHVEAVGETALATWVTCRYTTANGRSGEISQALPGPVAATATAFLTPGSGLHFCATLGVLWATGQLTVVTRECEDA